MYILEKETGKFTIEQLKFTEPFDESKRTEKIISPQDAEREINTAEFRVVQHYRDGGTMEVITEHATYWFEIAEVLFIKPFIRERRYKPYVKKFKTLKEGDES